MTGSLPPDSARRWVGVGTGRCGTLWTAATATALGSRTCHEDPVYWWAEDRAGEAWPYYEGAVSLAAIRWALDWPPSWRVVHVVRDPVAVVDSFVRTSFFADVCACHADAGEHLRTPYASFLARHAPAAFDETYLAETYDDPALREVARTCRYVVDWNLRCEAVLGPYLRFAPDAATVEDVAVLAGFAWERPIDPGVVLERFVDGDRNRHAPTEPSRVTPRMLSTFDDGRRLLDLAGRYGYRT